MRISADEWLESIPPDSVRVLAGEGGDRVPASVLEWIGAWAPVVVRSEATALEPFLAQIVESLAKLASLMWPHWYQRQIGAFDGHANNEAVLINEVRVRELLKTLSGVARGWVDRAIALAAAGRPLLLQNVPLEIQVQQLVLALDDPELRLALVQPSTTTSADLKVLARAAEWLRLHSKARVLVVVPSASLGDSALDSIAYEALMMTSEELVEEDEPEVGRRSSKVRLGTPHHASLAEQKLARALSSAPDLAPLFQLNGRLRTVRDETYTVDLLWPEGRFVVEVDGWSTHGGRKAFAADRKRDYELMLLEHRVLRITDDEITTDIGLVLAKIRDVVALINQTRKGQ